MNKTLSNYFSLNRRYSRSVNLERDLERLDALEGYILTERSVDALRRILTGMTTSDGHRAWTVTSVYGTGKSAFAHYLTALLADQENPMRQKALEIAAETLGQDSPEYKLLSERIPSQGLFRAIAVAQREPISNTIIRALYQGADLFWSPQKRSKLSVGRKLTDFNTQAATGSTVDSREIPKLIKEILQTTSTDIFLFIDELGKNLEYAARNQGAEDLYLLQQLAELSTKEGTQVYIVGLLHQAFVDYGERLAAVQRSEWSKIQGRFEDIPFQDSPAQMMRLIGQAIDASQTDTIQGVISNQTQDWIERLPNDILLDTPPEILASNYPLHPLAALVLPMLCVRYAQNDRSLFTFLTSAEPYSFKNFLEETPVGKDVLPTLKLARIYDYFIEAVGMGLASRSNVQRWVEIHGLITDAKHLDADTLEVLKTIGTLNLVTTTGAIRATRKLVTLALCDSPNSESFERWEKVIENLLQKGLINHRRQLDELRIWQGSDFNVDLELTAYIDKERAPLVKLLSDIRPLKPLVAQRHSYEKGTLRYFERYYIDTTTELTKLQCSDSNFDGLVGYWIDIEPPAVVPSKTADGKPLILLCAAQLDVLRVQAKEYAALKTMRTNAPELQSDGVARREVRYRLLKAEESFDNSLNRAFDVAVNQNLCWVEGQPEKITHVTDFNAKLSEVCDRVYSESPILWNELINRRELTSQGAKARRELIEAMLLHPDQERLSLEGYGPEVSIYYSLLAETGIHQLVDGEWGFYPPSDTSKIWTLWQAIETFCLEAKEKPQTVDQLYQLLSAPPYGVKQGAIPVILAAVLLYHIDDVGVYKDGTFVPVLGPEHFELLVKYPERYAVKYFEVVGLRSQVFRELEAILRRSDARKSGKLRNATLLSVVTPLYQFVNKLPVYTRQTKRLSSEAQAVLKALQQTIEPDELLFKELPQACNLPPIGTDETEDETIAKALRTQLVQILRDLHTAYDCLLNDCQKLLYDAFAVRSEETKLREDLRVRANYISGRCVESILNRFTRAATDTIAPDQQWLEALLMIVADKPAESWKDEDITSFELKLSDISRRFKNLEALQKEAATKGEGFEARRITVTRPDGQETHRMVWVENEKTDQLEHLVDKVLQDPLLINNPQLQQAFIAKLTEKVFGVTSGENVTKIHNPRQSKKDKPNANQA